MKHSSVPAYSMGAKYPAEQTTTDKLTPAPNTYNVRKEEIIVPARSFGKAQRSASAPKSILPGPGSYKISSFLELSMREQSRRRTKPYKEKSEKSKIESPGPASYNPKKPKMIIGYTMGNKTFDFISPGGTNIGPDHYSPSLNSIKPAISTSFTKSSREPNRAKPEGPGPATYLIKEISSSHQCIFPKELRGKVTGPNSPGPGEYNIPSLADELRHKMGKTMLPKRAAIIKGMDSPGPGSYKFSLNQLTPSYSVGRGRRSDLIKLSNSPGPGQYSPVNPTHIVQSKSIGTGNRPPIAKISNSPGPGAYESKTFLETGPKYSLVGRKPETREEFNMPGPGQYNPDLNVTRPEGTRIGIGKGLRINQNKRGVKAFPGPGAYDASGTNESPKWTFKKELKNKNNFEDDPGPGQYEIPASVPDVPKYLFSAPLKSKLG